MVSTKKAILNCKKEKKETYEKLEEIRVNLTDAVQTKSFKMQPFTSKRKKLKMLKNILRCLMQNL